MPGVYNPATGTFTTSNSGTSLQGGAARPSTVGNLQAPTVNPQLTVSGDINQQSVGGGAQGGTSVAVPTYDPAAAAAAATAAKAAALRGQITSLANTVKDIFNSRYGQVDQAAQEQAGNLNDRFGKESSDVTQQVADENGKIGAASASAGTYDSSYRGNNVDTVTKGGESQIADLGTELRDNLAKIASYVTTTKSGFDAQKGGIDAILSHLAEETDPGNLSTIRGTLDSRIADLKAGSADNNTQSQNLATLATIAPSTPRAVQLKTTLSQIVAGSADPAQKAAIGAKLISSANLSDDDAQKLQAAFQSDLAGTQQDKQQVQA